MYNVYFIFVYKMYAALVLFIFVVVLLHIHPTGSPMGPDYARRQVQINERSTEKQDYGATYSTYKEKFT